MGIRKYLLICIVLILAMYRAGNAAPSNPYDDFVGTFVGIENGKEFNFIKIEKDNDDYMSREWSETSTTWGEPFKLESAEMFLSRSADFQDVIGFNAGMVLIIKVPVGWKYGRFTSQTGFALISDFGGKDGLDLYKNSRPSFSSPGELPPRPPGMVSQVSPGDQILATVNSYRITAGKVVDHAGSVYLSRQEALEDLIDITLVKQAVKEYQISAPEDGWYGEGRTKVESALAQALRIELPPPRVYLIIDHAWLKDAEDEATRRAGRKQLELLRKLVTKGATIPEAYRQLQADGSLWHIGDHEKYEYGIISAEARDLPEGGLSKIIPGDGGLHLYKIHQRKAVPASSADIQMLLNLRLRSTATIEYGDTQVSGE